MMEKSEIYRDTIHPEGSMNVCVENFIITSPILIVVETFHSNHGIIKGLRVYPLGTLTAAFFGEIHPTADEIFHSGAMTGRRCHSQSHAASVDKLIKY